MSLEEVRKRILEDDAFVLEEIQKIRILYKLKKEIRYAQERHSEYDTESVAEHVYGMHVIAQYFLPLEDRKREWDKIKIFETITLHDIDEVETGDTVSHHKTEVHEKQAQEAFVKVLGQMPEHMQSAAKALIEEYEERQTIEAKFVKAIDKSEPLFEVWDEVYKGIMHGNNNSLDDHWRTKKKYIEEFPYIKRFVEVATDRLNNNGFFVDPA